MWKNLNSMDTVNPGDKIRYVGAISRDGLFEVTKSEQHYFEVSPATSDEALSNIFNRKVIRYFDIGYNIRLELWTD